MTAEKQRIRYECPMCKRVYSATPAWAGREQCPDCAKQPVPEPPPPPPLPVESVPLPTYPKIVEFSQLCERIGVLAVGVGVCAFVFGIVMFAKTEITIGGSFFLCGSAMIFTGLVTRGMGHVIQAIAHIAIATRISAAHLEKMNRSSKG